MLLVIGRDEAVLELFCDILGGKAPLFRFAASITQNMNPLLEVGESEVLILGASVAGTAEVEGLGMSHGLIISTPKKKGNP